MTSFKLFGATLVLSAFLATPASAWEAISEPAAAAAADPTFSIYSNDGRGFSRTTASQVPLGDASDCICRYGRIAEITPPASSATEHGLRIASLPD